MSLLMIDIAYVGTKSLLSFGYYVVKGTYNGIAYLTGHEMITDRETSTEKDLLAEIKSLRGEMDSLRKEIMHINEDTFLLVDPDTKPTKSKVIAEIYDNVNIDGNSDSDKDNDNDNDKEVTL